MDVFDKFLQQYSWKFPKGYPDLSNNEDVALLEHILEELIEPEYPLILSESDSEEEIYNSVIKRTLNLEEIPKSKGKYQFSDSTFEINVSSEDKEVFDKLFNVAPPKKGEEEGETKGVGNGEVALYWLYNFSENSPQTVTVGRKGDDPDLFFNGKGVEVKAYSTHKGKISLGRFGSDKENLRLLSIAFGISALSEVLGDKKPLPSLNPTNFKGEDLINTFEKVIELSSIEHLEDLAKEYEIFDSILKNIMVVNKILNNPKTPEEAAQNMGFKIVSTKLSRKPGSDGYLANVLKNGNIKFFRIDFSKLKNDKNLLENFIVSQSSIKVNFSNIFK